MTAISASVVEGRRVVSDILAGRDKRLMVITGPCSIHSYEIAMDYARRLSQLQQEVPIFILLCASILKSQEQLSVGKV